MTGISKFSIGIRELPDGARQSQWYTELSLELPTEIIESRLGRELPPLKGRGYRILFPVSYKVGDF
jgi:hypothetical protein